MMMMVAPAQVHLNVILRWQCLHLFLLFLCTCRQSSIPGLAQVHGRDRAAVKTDPLERRTFGEPVQRSDAPAVSREEKVS